MAPRSARFEVLWCDDANMGGRTPEPLRPVMPLDYVVLELRHEDLVRLKKQVDLALKFGPPKEGEPNNVYHCLLFHGHARPQRHDAPDGTTTYPPSLLSEEVLAETPRESRWRPE